jgi:hypothetical protein
MAQFSIKESVKFSFAAYGKHCVLLLSASALVGASLWVATVAPRYVSQKLGIEHHLIRQDTTAVGISYNEAKADPSTITQQGAEGMISRIFARPQESVTLILVTVFGWGLFLMLLLGCMKLGLSLVDKTAGSLQLFLNTPFDQMMRFAAASMLIGLLVGGLFVGIGVSFVLKIFLKGIVGSALGKLLALVLGSSLVIFLFVTLLRYVFYGYCLVDNPALSAVGALERSRKITRSSLWALGGAALVYGLFVITLGYGVNVVLILTGIREMMGKNPELIQVVCTVLITPFTITYFSFIYRALTQQVRA